MTEIPSLADLKLLIEYCSGRHGDKLPENATDTFSLVQMADFLGCNLFLVTVAEQLGTSVCRINNSNGIKYVRKHIRNRY